MKCLLKVALVTLLSSSFVLSVGAQTENKGKTVTVTGIEAPKGGFSDDFPDYLSFKEVVVTREGVQRIKFDITLWGDLPANPKQEISYYIGFDIDANTATGGSSVNNLEFGHDMGVHIYQNRKDSRFKTYSSSVEVKNIKREITIGDVKAKGNKLIVELRSELFSLFDSFKFFLSSSQKTYDGDKELRTIQVSVTPITTF